MSSELFSYATGNRQLKIQIWIKGVGGMSNSLWDIMAPGFACGSSMLNDMVDMFNGMNHIAAYSYGESFPPKRVAVQKDGSLKFQLALAGYKKENLHLEVNTEENAFTIKGESDTEEEDSSDTIVTNCGSRLKFGEFTREYTISPKYWRVDSVQTNYADGVLTLIFPVVKAADNKVKQIALQ